jgi:hypothetical protein
MKSSWALIVDLGYQVQTTLLGALLDAFWARSEVSGPQLQLGRFRSLPQASEGRLQLAQMSGKCYTKLESDKMGYPQGWPATVLLTLSLYDFPVSVNTSPELQAFLIEQAQAWYTQSPYRMAVVADSSSYCINADFASSEWLAWQQDKATHLLLPGSHPLTQRLSSGTEPAGNPLNAYAMSALQPPAEAATESTRYQQFQQALRKQKPPTGLSLEWESD